MIGTSAVRSALAATAVGLVALVAACGPGITVNSDYDPASLSAIQAYKTYSWLPDPPGGQQQGQIIQGRVIAAVDAELANKGYRKVSSDPDFGVGWHVATQDKMDVQTFNDYYGYGYNAWGYGGPIYGQSTYVRNYTQGTLLIDVVDMDANQLVWRGAAEGEVDMDAKPEERTARVNDAIHRILADFPPGG